VFSCDRKRDAAEAGYNRGDGDDKPDNDFIIDVRFYGFIDFFFMRE
jgi:hypothetical protein